MRDTVITAAFKKRELMIVAGCFVVAMLVNIGAILWYNSAWIEIVSQIGYVVCLTAILYVVIVLFRVITSLIRGSK